MKTDSRILLADVNVLLALAWPNHQFHPEALYRFVDPAQQWATCALTQLAFVRLSSNPATGLGAKSPAESEALLRVMTADSRHVFFETLPAMSSEKFAATWSILMGHKQINDAYLVRLASYYNAKLLTFDRRLTGLAEQGSVEVVLPFPNLA